METALEYMLTHSYKAEMISYLAAHREAFDEAVKLAVSDKQPYAWRAAWLLWSCMEDNDPRIQGFMKRIMDTITGKKDDHQRELLKILLRMELPEKYESFLFNICSVVWGKIGKKPSVRLTAFKIMVKITRKHPDLAHEITFLTQNQYMDTLSPVVKRAVSRLIKEFEV